MEETKDEERPREIQRKEEINKQEVRRPHPGPMVHETWLAAVSVTTRIVVTASLEEPATPGQGRGRGNCGDARVTGLSLGQAVG